MRIVDFKKFFIEKGIGFELVFLVATSLKNIIFGSGYLRIPDMVRTGVWMNLISIIIIVLATYYVLPLIWDFELATFSMYFK